MPHYATFYLGLHCSSKYAFKSYIALVIYFCFRSQCHTLEIRNNIFTLTMCLHSRTTRVWNKHIYNTRSVECSDQEGAGGLDPLEKYKNIEFLSNTSADPVKIHKATKPALNVGPSSACQRNAIKMAFRWRADGGTFLVLFVSALPLFPCQRKCYQSWTPSGKTFWIRACTTPIGRDDKQLILFQISASSPVWIISGYH